MLRPVAPFPSPTKLLSSCLLVGQLSWIGLLWPVASIASDPVFTPCELGDPETNTAVRALCTTLVVPENHDEPDGETLELFVARLEARSSDTHADPLTVLAGGPGQSATESFPAIQSAFEAIRKQRDIYLIDQRGTGKSNKLECPDTSDETDSLRFDAELTSERSRACLEALTGNPIYYTTSVAVRDLELVRRTLNLAQWNIYGISYGTRVGLHYLRQHPDSIRTLILDAVVPPTVSLGATISTAAEQAFEQMLNRCASSESCKEAFPELATRTRKMISSLGENPREITFENFNSGQLETIDFGVEHLTTSLRMLSYSSHGISILPALLHDAYHNDNFAPLARQASLQANALGASLASGMHNAVICTEDQPYIELTDAQRSDMQSTYLGLIPIDALNASCKYWPRGIMDENFKDPVTTDKAVLILSGGADPVTPPEFGDIVAETMPNALHIVNPGQGHMQAWLGCTPGIMHRYIEHANTKDIDYGCLERQEPLPFFIDANGPKP